jgi:hypothetical protein
MVRLPTTSSAGAFPGDGASRQTARPAWHRAAIRAVAVLGMALALGATWALYQRPGTVLDLSLLLSLCGLR